MRAWFGKLVPIRSGRGTMNKVALVCAAYSAACLSSPSQATQFVFSAALSGANEVPANTSSASGSITVVADDSLGSFTVSEKWSGLSGSATGAHIHCCAASGATAPIVVPFTLFPAATSGAYSGTFFPATFQTTLAGMQAGLAYANIHTALLPGGEIRGQLVAGSVPEVGTWLMMITGFGMIGAAMRRHGRSTSFENA